MELAVNMPEQEPAPGQARHSREWSSSALILPALKRATASNTLFRSSTVPSSAMPAAIGPPLQKIVGILQRRAPMIMPGTILSQFGMQIMASNAWALSIVSTLSAINSRLARENFMPPWPMAMPSQTPGRLNSTGVPPALRTSSLMRAATLFRWTWPGITSLKELQMAMKGRLKSSSVIPVARIRLRCGARSNPALTLSLRITI